jgi:hypothetical protein
VRNCALGRAIQYAEASRSVTTVSGILGHPLSRVTTQECVAPPYSPINFSHSSSVSTCTPCGGVDK